MSKRANFSETPVVRILFYIDQLSFEDPCSGFGVSELKRLILLKTKCIFDAEITLVNRHTLDGAGQEINGANRLTEDVLRNYDELWVFGFRQANTAEHPRNELDGDEVAALAEWMKRGGVLVTGDHAQPDERMEPGDKRREDHRTFLGLGRALGHRIPRAGQLRVWEGPPTNDRSNADINARDNVNTLTGSDLTVLDVDASLQADSSAQDLILVEQGDLPHKLFWWFVDAHNHIFPILKFPDHMHEGKLRVLDFLDGEWPGAAPPPEVVVRGTDKRPLEKPRTYDLVMTYDGDQSGVGRIVADSTFHHYIDLNLSGFLRDTCGNPFPISDLDQIAQYYANLALWLAPLNLREQISARLALRLVNHPQMIEEKGNDFVTLGRTALEILNREIGRSNLYRLFAPSDFERPTASDWLVSAFFLGKVGTLSLPERLHQLVLGAIINFWQQTTLQSIGGVTSAESLTAQPDLLAETVKEALETHLLPSESLSAEDRKAIRELLGMADEATGERAGGDDGNGG